MCIAVYHGQFRHLLKWFYTTRLAELADKELTKADRERKEKEGDDVIALLEEMKKLEDEMLEVAQKIGDGLQDEHRKLCRKRKDGN